MSRQGSGDSNNAGKDCRTCSHLVKRGRTELSCAQCVFVGVSAVFFTPVQNCRQHRNKIGALLFSRITWRGLALALWDVFFDWFNLYIGALFGAAIAVAATGGYVLSSRHSECLSIYAFIGLCLLPASTLATIIKAAAGTSDDETESDD